MKHTSNDRRRFLGACLALSAAPATMAGCPLEMVSVSQHSGRMLHLRHEVAEMTDASVYLRLRARLATRSLSPCLRSWMEALDDGLPYRYEALVEIAQDSGEIKLGTLLNFYESFDPEPDTPALTFVDWLPRFRPEGRDDFLMALPLYELYRYSGTILPVIRPTPDPWLDAMLGRTRGMLFWRQQYVELVRLSGGMDHGRATQLIQDYVKRLPGAVSALEQIRYAATDQNVMQIITERSSDFGPHGTPDYLATDWLRRHWAAWPVKTMPSNRSLPILSFEQLAHLV